MDAYNELDRPLFGVSTRRERLINLIVGIITCLCVAVTSVLSFIPMPTTDAKNIYFSFCIAIVCVSLLIMIHWYRQGDVDPKFKKLIYFNSASIVLLCTCAAAYIFSQESACTKKMMTS